MKVPKNPLASWTPLVAMMRVPICACIDPLDRIGLSSLSRQIGVWPLPFGSDSLAKTLVYSVALRGTEQSEVQGGRMR
jgi:hypothetical protein